MMKGLICSESAPSDLGSRGKIIVASVRILSHGRVRLEPLHVYLPRSIDYAKPRGFFLDPLLHPLSHPIDKVMHCLTLKVLLEDDVADDILEHVPCVPYVLFLHS